MELTPYISNPEGYKNHYLKLEGGGLPYFQGYITQKGFGLGNILAGVARSVIPLIKKHARPILKKGAKSIGRQVAKSGTAFLKDVIIEKKHPKKSLRKRASETLHDVLEDTLGHTSSKNKRARKDIFD
jgi:hypothetical protein